MVTRDFMTGPQLKSRDPFHKKPFNERGGDSTVLSSKNKKEENKNALSFHVQLCYFSCLLRSLWQSLTGFHHFPSTHWEVTCWGYRSSNDFYWRSKKMTLHLESQDHPGPPVFKVFTLTRLVTFLCAASSSLGLGGSGQVHLHFLLTSYVLQNQSGR